MKSKIIRESILVLVALVVPHMPQNGLASEGEESSKGVVKSLNGLAGGVTLSAGAGLRITNIGNGLQIANTFNPTAPTSINGLTGAVTLLAGRGITISNIGNVISISGAPTLPPLPDLDWSRGGNSAKAGDFLGTVNAVPLDLKANGVRVLRLEAASDSPNIIGGSEANEVFPGVVGANVGGGGTLHLGDPFGLPYPNYVGGNFGTVAGGLGNGVLSFAAAIGGGYQNLIHAGCFESTIAGGAGNLIASNASTATIAGGAANFIGTNNTSSTIGGGTLNTIHNLRGPASASTVGGGTENEIAGFASVIAGGNNNSVQGDDAVIAGGEANLIQSDVVWSAIGGGYRNMIEAGSWLAVITGGYTNLIEGQAVYSSIGGGVRNTIQNGADKSTIGGGAENINGASQATISGGMGNRIEANAADATIAGGFANIIWHGSFESSIGGGSQNIIVFDSPFSTIAGGVFNFVSATSSASTVGGGENNAIAFGADNATIPGGSMNRAGGDLSFAAGHRANANDRGSFVWADATEADFASSAANEFSVRATGGTRFVSALDGNGNALAGVALAPGSGSWSSLSDRNAKTNFTCITGREILKRLESLPILKWNYKAQDASIHHIGPMAQDFHAAFGVGEDDQHISSVDAGGIALAALQGLQELLSEKEVKILTLEQRVASLEKVVQSLAQRCVDPAQVKIKTPCQ